MYLIESSGAGLTLTDVGSIQNESLQNLARKIAMDFNPDGNLYVHGMRSVRGRFSRYYKYGEIYQVDPATVGDDTAGDAAEPFPTKDFGSFGSGDYFDGGLAFRGDGSFYTMGDGNTLGRQLWLTDTSGNTRIFTKTNYFSYYGLEWYDDGTDEGLLLGIQETNGGALLLHQVITTGTGYFYGQNYANLPYVSGLHAGDLSISGDTLYILMTDKFSSSGGSRLYSYDLSQGLNGAFVNMGDLELGNLKSLAAIPMPVPVPAALVLGSLGLSVSGWVLRRKKNAAA